MSLTIKDLVEAYGISEDEAEAVLFGGSCQEQEDEHCYREAKMFLNKHHTRAIEPKVLAAFIQEMRDQVRDPLVVQLLHAQSMANKSRVVIQASKYVSSTNPAADGIDLARAVIGIGSLDSHEVDIDVSLLPSTTTISAFFYNFLQEIYDTDPGLLDKAKKIGWLTRFSFQRENIYRWVADFKPFVK